MYDSAPRPTTRAEDFVEAWPLDAGLAVAATPGRVAAVADPDLARRLSAVDCRAARRPIEVPVAGARGPMLPACRSTGRFGSSGGWVGRRRDRLLAVGAGWAARWPSCPGPRPS
ncbi:MAG: hypothetical protein WKF75_15760 [Singulisphaera sp.]